MTEPIIINIHYLTIVPILCQVKLTQLFKPIDCKTEAAKLCYFEIDISLPTATEMIGDVEREPKYHLMFTEFMRKSGM